MRFTNRLSVTFALAACASLAAPAVALDLPYQAPIHAYDNSAENAAYHRDWRRNKRVDAGDVIAGVLILGGIAAVASAANRSRDVERYPTRYPSRYPYPEDPRYRDNQRGWQTNGIDRAVDMCVAEIERGRDRVAAVESASRGVDGWFVSGEIEGGALFTCRIDNDGRIDDVQIGGGSARYPAAGDERYGDGRYDDDRYGDDGYTGNRYSDSSSSDDRQYDEEVYRRARADLTGPPGS